jgi:xanthine/CO dehydrogenase XdhC/CoxF family maturation factor
MNTWRETQAVFDEMACLAAAGRACALATLTRAEGSSYRRPGARLLIRDDGSMLGNVSGGCLEADLRERALRVIRTGRPESVHYDTGGDVNVVWGLGLGCNGKLDLYLQPAPLDQIETVRRGLAGDLPFELRAGDFVDRLEPPPPLLVIGAGEDAAPLVRLAAHAGFRVWVVDHRPAALRSDLFPDAFRLVQARPEDEDEAPLPLTDKTLALLKNHNLALDRAWAQRLTDSPVCYIGLLGPKARREEILRSLATGHRPRVFGPAGLDVGADGPGQVALSIVAELLAVRAGRAGGHLRDRSAPIH